MCASEWKKCWDGVKEKKNNNNNKKPHIMSVCMSNAVRAPIEIESKTKCITDDALGLRDTQFAVRFFLPHFFFLLPCETAPNPSPHSVVICGSAIDVVPRLSALSDTAAAVVAVQWHNILSISDIIFTNASSVSISLSYGMFHMHPTHSECGLCLCVLPFQWGGKTKTQIEWAHQIRNEQHWRQQTSGRHSLSILLLCRQRKMSVCVYLCFRINMNNNTIGLQSFSRQSRPSFYFIYTRLTLTRKVHNNAIWSMFIWDQAANQPQHQPASQPTRQPVS